MKTRASAASLPTAALQAVFAILVAEVVQQLQAASERGPNHRNLGDLLRQPVLLLPVG